MVQTSLLFGNHMQIEHLKPRTLYDRELEYFKAHFAKIWRGRTLFGMPHIHDQPGQHDLTASAFIVRTDFDEPKLMLHMHKKLKRYMQFGGACGAG